MRKLGEKMKEKQEQIVMRISFWSGVVFALAELIMAIFSKSQSVLADTVILLSVRVISAFSSACLFLNLS